MERIQNILQRIQELYYSKHEKSVIDVDLMLDYTRVMYADLLEWKSRIPAVKEENVKQQKVENKLNEDEITSDQPDIADVEAKESSNDEQSQVMTEEKGVIEDPQQQIAELIQVEDRGISFEPPHPATHPEVVNEILIEEEPEVNKPVENIEIPVEDISAIPDKPSVTKDIRLGIGINDKYLFLNELFNNHKTEYEEALDYVNRLGSYEKAYNWLMENAAVSNKWQEEDETAQNFFSVLKKHFSASR